MNNGRMDLSDLRVEEYMRELCRKSRSPSTRSYLEDAVAKDDIALIYRRSSGENHPKSTA